MQNLVIEARHISKHFAGVVALDNVNFELRTGEIHALMGENGAGKSTLAKVISGVLHADAGEVIYRGQPVYFTGPKQAIDQGISMVMQEFNLLPDLDVAENIFINRADYYTGLHLRKRREMERDAQAYLERFGLSGQISPRALVGRLSVAEKQIVEIIKAVATDAKVIFLDEPTAALSPAEVDKLFDILRELKNRGISFVVVSHRIQEIFAISDRVTVLRDGQLVFGGAPIATLTEQSLVKAMVGRDVSDLYAAGASSRPAVSSAETPILTVDGICDADRKVKSVSFSVYAGEILGISGLMGAGRTELIRAVFGIDKRSAGTVTWQGTALPPGGISASIRQGMAFVPEDRKTQGLILSMSIFENLSMAYEARSPGVLTNRRANRKRVGEMQRDLSIKMPDASRAVSCLSGGNQQKVLLGKWLALSPELLFIDEPTRGIDIGAKAEIYSILKQLAKNGTAVVMVSSEIPEILGVCDRVMVMKDGRIVKTMPISEADEETIGYYASVGGSEECAS